MILLNVQNPLDKTLWTCPRALQKISVTDQRREALSVGLGLDDAFDMYRGVPNPREAKTVTVSFRVTPRFRQTTFDALRRDVNRFVDHGLEQRLRFMDDFQNVWDGYGKLIGKDLDADQDQQFSADWTLHWRLRNGLLEAPASPSVLAWGDTGRHWGDPGLKWGATFATALTSSFVQFNLANPDADTETRDMVFQINGPFGPASPTGLRGGPRITIRNASIIDVNSKNWIELYILDTVLAGQSYYVDTGAVSILKSGAPAWGKLDRPDKQFGWMRIRPGDNLIQVFVEQGASVSPVNGTLTMLWKPSKSPA